MVEEREFDALFRKYYGELYVFAHQFLTVEADCEDMVSDAFEEVLLNMECIETAAMRAFLFKTVRNKCIDHLRRIQTRRQYAELMATVSQSYDRADLLAEQNERERIVGEVLGSLPDYTRQIFTSCYVDRESYAKVAERLSISTNTVKKYVSRALQLIGEWREKYKNV